MVIKMFIYKKVIADYLKNRFETVEVASISDDGTLFIKTKKSCDMIKLNEEVKATFPSIKKVAIV